MMRERASRKEGLVLLDKILEGDGGLQVVSESTDAAGKVTKLMAVDGDLYLKAREHVTKHGYGQPAQSVDLTSGGEPIRQSVIVFGGLQVEF